MCVCACFECITIIHYNSIDLFFNIERASRLETTPSLSVHLSSTSQILNCCYRLVVSCILFRLLLHLLQLLLLSLHPLCLPSLLFLIRPNVVTPSPERGSEGGIIGSSPPCRFYMSMNQSPSSLIYSFRSSSSPEELPPYHQFRRVLMDLL